MRREGLRSIAGRPPPRARNLSEPPITLLAGPTASGKSALALEMAERTGAVIINADSQQLYADLRVLSARPSARDEAQAEHRLYGVADAAEAWSVGRWSRAALDLLAELDGRPALFVGGLATNLDVPGARETAVNLGGQIDVRFSLLSVLDMTISTGAAIAFRDGADSNREAMFSLKILR